ncbi:IS21-like element helper ATPase IstB [Candidatus Bipolaricaulota bacterium]|nr:IS21-like element helper ATPase IstB [Candidatus Bipolaricaulota bacterium]
MDAMLKELRLPRIREIYDQRIDQAAEEDWGYRKFLKQLLQEEVTNRHQNRLERRKNRAGFPFEKTLNQFEFNFRPKLKKRVFQTYTEPRFVTEGKDLILIGPPGTGKTHLSVGIGLAQIKNDFKVLFKNVQSLAGELQGAERKDTKDELLESLLKVDLLILDEFGYLPLKEELGPFLYELIAGRYEEKSTIITSNKSLNEWGKTLRDNSLAQALIDRLIHHGEVYYLEGDSYRMKGKQDLLDREDPKGKNQNQAKVSAGEEQSTESSKD